jgi:hypothetical protein
MILKSGNRFSGKIVLKETLERDLLDHVRASPILRAVLASHLWCLSGDTVLFTSKSPSAQVHAM